MGGLLNFMRGINFLVPRNMTKAAGFYNSIMQTDEPALIVEPLNAYRIKEKVPINLGVINWFSISNAFIYGFNFDKKIRK